MSIISIANSNNNDHFYVTIFAAVRPSISEPVLQCLYCTEMADNGRNDTVSHSVSSRLSPLVIVNG